MDTRREFIRKAALLSGAAGACSVIPESLQQALAIEPIPGSSYMDAEHVVILMQENRSFDHCFGTLQGVRGFNDPRAVTLPNRNPVWLQTNKQGETYGPFRLNIRDTKSTWMGSLPHSWTNQVDALNKGSHDGWLDAKHSGEAEYVNMPLTMGYYTREDLPFYYALADSFTICDQHFCSSLTGTTPNRLYLWTGTVREKQEPSSFAHVLNEDVDYPVEAKWTTFPERLEDAGVSWKIYQNEISLDSGLVDEWDSWLTNFTDNPIEWFTQYNVRYHPAHRAYLQRQIAALPAQIAALQKQLDAVDAASSEAGKLTKQIAEQTEALRQAKADAERWSAGNFQKLSEREKALHAKAFCTNARDPAYRDLATIRYSDGAKQQEVQVPKGDVLHQFRQDAQSGALPTVSWLVAPEHFSDHPSSAWYGAWYVSEVLDILTKDPEVWKKTILILNYDENDGYFDHVPPFRAPNPDKPETGRVSDGMDARVEFVTMEQELKRKTAADARESSIGLGFRVPMIIASPWTRGGNVCSQVFDHTSVLQFLEKLLSHKTGKRIEEPNISPWRRAVCGDLTSAFQSGKSGRVSPVPFPARDSFIKGIHQAKFRQPPSDYKKLTDAEIEHVRSAPLTSELLPRQEKGVRRSCPLPYELYAETTLTDNASRLTLRMEARNEVFGARSAGAPFTVYIFNKAGGFKVRSYAVAAGASVTDSWHVNDLEDLTYHLQIHGPNGFFREFRGNGYGAGPMLDMSMDYARVVGRPATLSGGVDFKLANSHPGTSYAIETQDSAYHTAKQFHMVVAGKTSSIAFSTHNAHGWYDFSVTEVGHPGFLRRYAGRVETGNWSFTDPAMA